MKDGRPVNLDISTMKLPITAWASISHRVSGILTIPIFALFLWVLQLSLESKESFQILQENFSAPLAKVFIILVLTVYSYHLLAGIKHLIMDLGYGETFEGGVIGAKLLFACTGISFILISWWLW
tara:strand:- start:554 stop:928 length:375 start_codon:yes stop_codon:yes gene_type:complete